MNRVLKYKESLCRFIKDKSLVSSNDKLYDMIKNDDMIYSILFLTVMNSQNKKNKKSSPGYFTATSIQLLKTYVDLLGKKSDDVELRNQLDVYSLKSFQQNIESIKNSFYNNELVLNIVMESLDVYTRNKLVLLGSVGREWEYEDVEKVDIVKWYIKDDEELVNRYKKLKVLKKESLVDYINVNYLPLFEIALLFGWLFGGSVVDNFELLRSVAFNFAVIYVVSNDFCGLLRDIKRGEGKNYVLVHGLQESYNYFLSHKQKLIEDSMTLGIYTNTLGEIIDNIEAVVDNFLDSTDPDLKSTFTQ